MADLIVFNNVRDIEEKIKSNYGLAIKNIDDLKIAIENTIDNVAYHTIPKKMELSKLSCNNLIASCQCNFCGSGTSGTVGNSPWQTELSSSSPTLESKIYSTIINKPEMLEIKKEMDDLTSGNLKNNIKQFIEMYAREYIENAANSDELKSYWITFADFSNSFKVCSINFKAGEGASCTWNVPAGAKIAKFQLWGAGAGNTPGQCCGGAPFAANGAYSELTMRVNEGDSYIICAGCSCAINACWNQTPGAACMSGVTGPGICCLKADGSNHCNNTTMDRVRTQVGAGGVCNRFQNIYCTTSGACWCANGAYCFSGSCATCGSVPVYADCCDRTYCACGTDTTEISKDGIRPIHGGGCLDTNNHGCHIRPPMLDADTCEAVVSGCQCSYFTTVNCCGGCLSSGWDKHPGMGGAYSHVMNGAVDHKGDMGAGGMVKVSWK